MNCCRTLLLLGLLALCREVSGVDLHQIDRGIAKQPRYKSVPKYCLAVFGPSAQSPVWLVVDGGTLYADLNGNGDLTEEGEKFKAKVNPETKDLTFTTTLLAARDGVPKNTHFEILIGSLTFVYAHSEGRPWQRAVVDKQGYLAFAPSAATAPLLHFNGPLTVGQRFDNHLKITASDDFDVFVGSPGIGVGSFVRFGHAGIPPNLRPVANFSFFAATGKAIATTVVLDQRC